ncbi:bifunctional phosphopantothenoylcysteine decarboxylase/phosphopantothenate--cysteine ligase CoaBC [Psittacicella hinzii]|uniref:Coenzyme A biosynthesis bifunctional protein CoaBC n=1 Tax=Psittacicella hinzii TaxID=2028575 RepID=A0A3A1YAN4_9GAMM|nr:bifunctional phosphopantothenoylcysteine decarboxylase/phosphopantothenate--cysteine ligase CoaBC [Psittacicella hinzii]RIY34601.1 bifunctional phosphopantothenoylcysteine decarboxylase/phosphopantothenate--cysteine ligase CoaBC [Psittacicella hinzii]
MLAKNKLLIGITGSIAAYKTVFLVREAVKQGYDVKVVLTSAAKEFVTPLTLQALSKNKVYSELFDLEAELSMGHIELAKWADLMLIAPASANTIAKLAHGEANNLLSTLVLAKPQTTPLLIAPAMNKEMFDKVSNKENLAKLVSYGFTVLDTDQGDQACGDVGQGRMLEPEVLLNIVNQTLNNPTIDNNQNKTVTNAVGFCKSQKYVKEHSLTNDKFDVAPLAAKAKETINLSCDAERIEKELQQHIDNFQGKKIIVTAGPTREMIDPVRYITNHSSGKMGVYIAALAQKLGAKVTLIAGPLSVEVPEGIRTIKVESAEQMNNAVMEALIEIDVFIGCAAVGDFRAKEISTTKIKKANDLDELTITLVKNPDILYNVSNSTRRPKYVVGFAAETNNIDQYARTKIAAKGCDCICANDVSKENQGWNSDFNHIVLYRRDGTICDLGYDLKEKVAKLLVLDIARELYNRERE